MKRTIALSAVAALAGALLSLSATVPAVATEGAPCVPVAAVPAVAAQWSNWSPNDSQGAFEGEPVWPGDERGTWGEPNTEGGPGQDEVGTYQEGNGNGSWFHREVAKPAVDAVPCVVPFPTPEVTDPCGTGNAAWVKPADTDKVHWAIGDAGQLTGETQEGYVWPNDTTINGWGQASELNKDACPVVDVPPVDVCPDVTGDQPTGTDCNPPVDVPPADVPPVDVPPVDVATPASAVVLPDTGGSSALLAIAGLLMVGLGTAAVAAGRRGRLAL